MPSYIFRGINPELWDQVKAKAKNDRVTILAVVESLFRGWLIGNAVSDTRGRRIWGRSQASNSPQQEWAWEHAAEVYKERDLLVRALSTVYPSHLMYRKGHQPAGAKKVVVCIHSPAGQLAWTIPKEIQPQFSHLELTANDWDGHKTADRFARLAELKP